MEVELSGDRHDVTDEERGLSRSVLPTGCRGPVSRNGRRIMDGIFFIPRAGSPWRDLPGRYGPHATCCNRRSREGIRARIIPDLRRFAGPAGGADDRLPGGAGAQARLRLAPGR